MSAVTLKIAVDNLSSGSSVTPYILSFCLLQYPLFRIFAELCVIIKDLFFACIGTLIEKQVSCMVLDHVLSLSMQFHIYKESGKVTRMIYRGAYEFGQILQAGFFSVLPILVQFCLVISYLLVEYQWKYSVITLGAVCSYCVCTAFATRYRTRIKKKIKNNDNNFNQRAVDALTNVETIKFFNTRSLEMKAYSAAYHGFYRQTVRFYETVGVMNTGQQLSMAAGTLFVLLLMSFEIEAGTRSVGDLVLVNTYLLQVFGPMTYLSSYYKILTTAWVDVEAIMAMLVYQNEVADVPNAVKVERVKGHLTFENVSFAYGKDEPPILHDVSFTVNPGETIAIVGSSGAGKSTISKLIFRMYHPSSGYVLLDHLDTRLISTDSLLQHIAIVPQECCLFNDTLGYNLAYAILTDPLLDSYEGHMEAVKAAAKQAQLDDFIETLEDGYQTLVGERGLRLSGGQKQRVALARAVIKKPALICLDEATSALDSHTENQVLSTIVQISQTCTTVIISHRMSTVRHANSIIVLDTGRIVESGSHDLLMEKQGAYFSMVQRQHSLPDSVSNPS